MPAFPLLVGRDVTAADDAGVGALQVVCAWPVSGQYGPGSRVLYYALVAACVFARKKEWLRNACLAGALLFPAVAALHGIVLASVHVNGAIDLDIYGAFQLCAIGILAAPVTVKLSTTYFYARGRNIIFVWTVLILAGLLGLTVEFFRSTPTDCMDESTGKPLPSDSDDFEYGETRCGLTCSESDPISPIRHGATNNIYVIPAPERLTLNTATLLAAACCIPAILSLISMWNKILEINWMKRWGYGGEDQQEDEPIEGTNGATLETMTKVNNWIRTLLSTIEIPVFGAAVLAILIIGEMNFFSHPVNYQTEPMSSVGQWAPIVGTGLAALGSLYLLLARDLEAGKQTMDIRASIPNNNFPPMQQVPRGLGLSPGSAHSLASRDADSTDLRPSISIDGRETSNDLAPTLSRPMAEQGSPLRPSWTNDDAGNRRKVAKVLLATSRYLGTAAHDTFDDSDFRSGKAQDFPEIPGEIHRNKELPQIREQYNNSGRVTPLRERPSRAGSFTESLGSKQDNEGGPASPRPISPSSPGLPSHTPGRLRQRRDTLEVPSQNHRSPPRNDSPGPSRPRMITMPDDENAPSIILSPEPTTASPVQTTISGPAVLPSYSESPPPLSRTPSPPPQ